jgi:hypothetical protein
MTYRATKYEHTKTVKIKPDNDPANDPHFITPPLPKDVNTKNNKENTPTVLPLNTRELL